MKKIFLFLLAVTVVSFAQTEDRSVMLPNNTLTFHVDVSSHKSSEANKTRMDFLIEIPYTSIQFVKKDDGYYGGFEATLSFMDEAKENVLFEKSWTENLKSTDFNQTISKDNLYFCYKSYDLAPGKYFIKCFLEDSDSKRTAIRDLTFNVRKMSDSLDVSEVVLISEIIKDKAGDRIVPNASSIVSNRSKSLDFYFEIYSNKTRQINIDYTLSDIKNNASLRQQDFRTIKAGTNLIVHTIANPAFTVGAFLLQANVKDQEGKENVSVEKKITSRIYGVPANISDLDKAVDQMRYIASPDEIDFIRDENNYDAKLNKFLTFWDKKKPNPKSDENPIMYEYYRRVEFSNKNFKGFGEGWRSDMGLIYITFGPPSNVERHPFESNSKPYEIWDYYELNRSFIFLDQTGFGDYRLYNPDYSRWPGYRP